MARPGDRRFSGVGTPFLGKEAEYEAERRLAIRDEVEQYLIAARRGIPTQKPQALEWLEAVELLGPPYPGGLLAQPYGFAQDILAAQEGRDRYRAVSEYNRRAIPEHWRGR